MFARHLRTGLALSLAMTVHVAAHADFESQKQGLLNDIREKASKQDLRNNGPLQIFKLAAARGFVAVESGLGYWSIEGGGQVGQMNTINQDGSIAAERFMYWASHISEVYCMPEAVDRKAGFAQLIDGQEAKCFELATRTSQNAELVSDENASTPGLDFATSGQERLRPNYKATISFLENGKIKIDYTGGKYEQSIYMWSLGEKHPRKIGRKVQDKYFPLQDKLDQDSEEYRRIDAQIDKETYGEPFAHISAASDLNESVILNDFKNEGFFNLPLKAENVAQALELAESLQASDATKKAIIDIGNERLKIRMALAQENALIAKAGFAKSERQLQASADCKAAYDRHPTERPEACKLYRRMEDARFRGILSISKSLEPSRSARTQASTAITAIQSKALSNMETDSSFARVMVALALSRTKR